LKTLGISEAAQRNVFQAFTPSRTLAASHGLKAELFWSGEVAKPIVFISRP
jgi:hypothetical protein